MCREPFGYRSRVTSPGASINISTSPEDLLPREPRCRHSRGRPLAERACGNPSLRLRQRQGQRRQWECRMEKGTRSRKPFGISWREEERCTSTRFVVAWRTTSESGRSETPSRRWPIRDCSTLDPLTMHTCGVDRSYRRAYLVLGMAKMRKRMCVNNVGRIASCLIRICLGGLLATNSRLDVSVLVVLAAPSTLSKLPG